ncbi:MAG: hypothetical protein HFI50_14205 [Lachnospiraceae bacterium]|nr:hypothetical protein [Lachnospiraceae bacterium]
MDNAKTVNDSMTEIAEASDNQALAAAQITEGINQIAGILKAQAAELALFI